MVRAAASAAVLALLLALLAAAPQTASALRTREAARPAAGRGRLPHRARGERKLHRRGKSGTPRHAGAPCEYVYVNAGIPAADTVNAFLRTSVEREPAHTQGPFDPADPRASDFDYYYLQKLFQEIFRSSGTTYQDWCIHGFEANEAWAPFFANYTAMYGGCVRSMDLRAGVMLSDVANESSHFECARVDPANGIFGDSQPNEWGYPCVVQSLRLSKVFESLIHGGLKWLVLNMDLEGNDFPVWQDLVASGVLCALRDRGVHVRLLVDHDGTEHAMRMFEEHCTACGAELTWHTLADCRFEEFEHLCERVPVSTGRPRCPA